MAQAGRKEEGGGAGVVELAAEARRRKAGPAAGRPARPNPRFEGMPCRAVADQLLVELRYNSEVVPRLVAPHIVYRSPTGRINVGGTRVDNPDQPDDAFEPGSSRSGWSARSASPTPTSARIRASARTSRASASG